MPTISLGTVKVLEMSSFAAFVGMPVLVPVVAIVEVFVALFELVLAIVALSLVAIAVELLTVVGRVWSLGTPWSFSAPMDTNPTVVDGSCC